MHFPLCCFFYFQFVFIPTESEKRAKTFHLKYNVTKDCYCRVHNNQEEIPGWEKGVYKNESVLRKEERDWQMVSVNLRLFNNTSVVEPSFFLSDLSQDETCQRVRCLSAQHGAF